MVRKFGFELEYASGTTGMFSELHANGLMPMDYAHDYHCRCTQCAFVPMRGEDRYDDDGRRLRSTAMSKVADLRAQRDSTAETEFITRPISDWDDLQRIVQALTTAATRSGAAVTQRCGLHVHVDTAESDGNEVDPRKYRSLIVPAAYLAYERYFTEVIAPGGSVRKRDMNTTLMQAARQWVSDMWGSGYERWTEMGRGAVDEMLRGAIERDRHVDLNWSRTHSTWEFRAMNATNAPWRIELACRMAVAFVEAAPELRAEVERAVRGSKYWPAEADSPWSEIIRPAFSQLPAPHPTKRPVVPMERFIDILCEFDPDLRPLIERQASYMRTRYAVQVTHAV